MKKRSIKHAIIVDLDGTLAIFEGVRQWHEFDKVEKDLLREGVAVIIRNYKNDVIIISGRPKSCQEQTKRWLKKNKIKYSFLYMRDNKDDRPDLVVKKEIYEKCVKPFYKIDFVLDDRNSVVEMWRELGLDCYQVDITNY